MKEKIIHLSEHLKGLTDGERTILWQALTVDIMGRMLNEGEALYLGFSKERGGLCQAAVYKIDPETEIDKALMTFGGEPVGHP
jgi:hypothetical protein